MSRLLLHVFNYAKKKKTTVFPFKEKCTAGSNLEIRIDSLYICKIKQVHQKNVQLFPFFKMVTCRCTPNCHKTTLCVF